MADVISDLEDTAIRTEWSRPRSQVAQDDDATDPGGGDDDASDSGADDDATDPGGDDDAADPGDDDGTDA